MGGWVIFLFQKLSHRFFMYFWSEMKLDIRVIISLGIQEPLALGQVNNMAIFIFRDIGLLEPRKVKQLFLVMAG